MSNKAKESSSLVNAAPANTLFSQFNEREKMRPQICIERFHGSLWKKSKERSYCLDVQIQDLKKKKKRITALLGHYQLSISK